MPLSTLLLAAALPLVQLPPPTPAEMLPIAAQSDARPHGTVRLQCRVYAGTTNTDACVAVTADETLDEAAFDARRRMPSVAGSIEDVAVRLTVYARGALPVAPANGMVVIDRTVDLRGLPVAAPSGDPALTPSTVAVTPGPGFAVGEQLYPPLALRDGREGRVVATCRIRPDHGLDCFRARIDRGDDQPSAARRIDDSLVGATFRMIEGTTVAPTDRQGRATTGRDFTVGIVWRLPT